MNSSGAVKAIRSKLRREFLLPQSVFAHPLPKPDLVRGGISYFINLVEGVHFPTHSKSFGDLKDDIRPLFLMLMNAALVAPNTNLHFPTKEAVIQQFNECMRNYCASPSIYGDITRSDDRLEDFKQVRTAENATSPSYDQFVSARNTLVDALTFWSGSAGRLHQDLLYGNINAEVDDDEEEEEDDVLNSVNEDDAEETEDHADDGSV